VTTTLQIIDAKTLSLLIFNIKKLTNVLTLLFNEIKEEIFVCKIMYLLF